MDPSQYSPKAPGSVPPLGAITTLGTLVYLDGSPGGVPIKIDIQGNIDKGFFQAEGEWTCYRRNYFSCVCSYSLTPYYPNQPMPMQYTQNGAQQSYTVVGFAMCISAVVADSDQTIDLVQHTPKRDKGPTAKPEKVRLLPKTPQTTHHSLGLYGHDPSGLGGAPRMGYAGDPYSGTALPGDAYQTEHTFERIQFKQATANNGKRRAAQQYYHLLVELWADVGNQSPDSYVRIAHRKSAKMIVRGRSPGHYQNERRGSTSSGPGGSAGSMGGYGGNQLMSSDYASGNTMLGGGYGAGFDSRGGMHYGGARHHHDLPLELSIPPDEAKHIDTAKGYQYFPGSIYESSHQDGRGGVDMFTNGHHHRSGQEGVVSHMATGVDQTQDRARKDPENGLLPSLFHQGPLASSQRCGPFDAKTASGGYYPTLTPQPGIDIPNIV